MTSLPPFVPGWARGMISAHRGEAWFCVGCNRPFETPTTTPCPDCSYSGRSSSPVPDPPAARRNGG